MVLSSDKSSMVAFIIITAGLLNFGSKSLMVLLNSNVARLSNHGFGGIDFICNKTINMSTLLARFFHGLFYKPQAFLCLLASDGILV